MAVYDVQGIEKATAYGTNGNMLSQAYNLNGNPLLNSIPVMTFNPQGFTGLNSDAVKVSSIISQYDPVFIGFQEATDGNAINATGLSVLNEFLNYFSGTAPEDVMAANYIFSNAETVVYSDIMTDRPRAYNTAQITINGKVIKVYNTHLGATSTGETLLRYLQAKQLFDAVENDDYFIIVGDFNTTCHAKTDADYINVYKQFADAGYNLANCSGEFGFNDTWFNGTTIANSTVKETNDNIITSANIDITRVIIDQTKLAEAESRNQQIDHLPLVAFLKVN